MRFDNLVQFIVPLTFLAIWAITSLFNRDAQPLPPRRGPGLGGGPPSGGGTPFGPDRVTEPSPRSAGLESSLGQGTRLPSQRGGEEGIVIVDAPARRPRRERRERSESKGDGAGKSAPRTAPRAGLTVDMHRPTSVPLREMEGLASLRSTTRPLEMPGHDTDALPPEESATPSRPIELIAPGGGPIRALTATPQQLRGAFLVAEVLFRPPLGLASMRRPTPPRAVRRPPGPANDVGP